MFMEEKNSTKDANWLSFKSEEENTVWAYCRHAVESPPRQARLSAPRILDH